MLPGVEVVTFEHSDTLFPVNRVPRGGAVRALPPAPALDRRTFISNSRGEEYDLFDYLADNRVAGLLVLKDGKVAFEDYELGAGRTRAGSRFLWLNLWPQPWWVWLSSRV